jgi:hypothetical protein
LKVFDFRQNIQQISPKAWCSNATLIPRESKRRYLCCVCVCLCVCVCVCLCVCVCVCVCVYMCVRVLRKCPHTTTCLSSYCYICVLILLYMCPHTAIYVSSYYFLCPHSTTYVSSCAYARSNPPQQDLYQERLRELPHGFKRWHMSMHWCRLVVCVVKGVACIVCVLRSILFMS